MEHAKKMALVDSNFVIDPRNIKKHYSSLDQSVVDVLNRQDIDDYGKLVLYRIALNKFLINKRALETDLDEPLKVTVDSSKVEGEPVLATSQLVKDEIAASTSTKFPSLTETAKETVETSRSKKFTNKSRKKRKVTVKERTVPSPPLSRKRKRTRTQWISL